MAPRMAATAPAAPEAAIEEPTLSNLPTVEVPRISTVVLESPVVILSAPCAGSTLLFETLAQAAGVYTIVVEIRQRFAGCLHDRGRQPPGSGARVRLVEKTSKNALRVPFLLEVFPDAQFIFLTREPRANLSSMMQAWRTKGWVTYRGLPGWPGPRSMLPPGYERLQGKPLEEIVAYQ